MQVGAIVFFLILLAYGCSTKLYTHVDLVDPCIEVERQQMERHLDQRDSDKQINEQVSPEEAHDMAESSVRYAFINSLDNRFLIFR